MLNATAFHLPIKSDGNTFICNPRRSLICEEKIMTAIPAVNPTISV
jgi:hypothetical protein